MTGDASQSGTVASDEESEPADSPNDTDISMLMSSATIVVFGQALYSVSSLLERTILTNALQPDVYAQVSIGFSLLMLGSTVSLFGLGPGIPRFMSRFKDESEVRGVFVTGMGIILSIGLTLAAILYWQVELLSEYLLDGSGNIGLLTLFIVAIPLVSTVKGVSASIRGMENTIYFTLARKIIYPGLRFVLIAVFLALSWGAMAAGYAYVTSAVVSLVVAVLLLRRLLPIWGPFQMRTREMTSFSAPLLLSGIAGVLLLNSDTVLVGLFRTNAEVAYYDAAYPLANGLLLFFQAFGFFYLPLASRLDSEDRVTEVDSIYRLSTKWIYLLTFPVFLLLFAFPADSLRIVFSPDYSAAWPALSILAVGFLLQAAAGRCTETLSAFGHTRTIFAISISTFLLNLVLNLLLIPQYGFVAAAATSAVSFGTQNAVTVLVLWRRFGITPFAPATVRTYVVLPLVLVPLSVAVSYTVSVTVPVFVALIVLLPVASLAVYLFTGCGESQDWIAVDLVEDKINRSIPFVDQVLPPRKD